MYIGINSEPMKHDKTHFVFKQNSQTNFQQTHRQDFFLMDGEKLKKLWFDYDFGFLTEYSRQSPRNYILLLVIVKMMQQGDLSIKEIKKLSLECENFLPIFKKIYDAFGKIHQQIVWFFSYYKQHGWNIACSLLDSHSFVIFRKNKHGEIHCSELWKDIEYNHLWLSISLIHHNLPVSSPLKNKSLIIEDEALSAFGKKNNIPYNHDLLHGSEHIEEYYTVTLIRDLYNLHQWNTEWKKFFWHYNDYNYIANKFLWVKDPFWYIKNNVYNAIQETIFSHTEKNNYSIYLSWRIVVLGEKMVRITPEHIQTINQKTGYNLTLDYSSKNDWFWDKWLQIEQWRSQWITHANHSHNISKKQDTIILNTIENKIYINNQKLTSNDLPSQSATINILSCLLDHQKEKISNNQLSQSSYTKNKNQMISKIITPFKRVIERKLEKEITFECRGSLYEFRVLLDMKWIEVQKV